MKKTIMALIVITLFSCKKTPSRVVTEKPTPEPIPCKVVFYTPQANTWMYLTVDGAKFETAQVETTPSCESGFILNSYAGKVLTYSFEIGQKTGSGKVTLIEGCNSIELK